MARIVIAADVGSSNVRVAAFADGLIQVAYAHERVDGLSYAQVIDVLERSIAKIRSRFPKAAAIGLSMAGNVDARLGTITHRALSDPSGYRETYPVCDRLKARFGVPVILENDGNAACIAEWMAGTACGAENLVSVTLGTGVGSAFVYQGELVNKRGCGGLLGSLPVPFGNSYRKASGICGGHSIELMAVKRLGTGVNGPQLSRLARSGCAEAQEVFRDAGQALGHLMASAADVCCPEVIVLSGSVMKDAPLLMPHALDTMKQYYLPAARMPAVVLGRHCQHAGITGAAIIACQDECTGLPSPRAIAL